MSFDALSWAAKQRPGNLASKMVLLALANYANEHGEAYPSTAAIADFGDMNHKTATAALDRLEALGLISDTGVRRGKSAQIKVYRLHLESHPKTEASQKRKPPASSLKGTQKRVTDTVKEPVLQNTAYSSEKRARRGSRLPDDWKPSPLPGPVADLVAQWPEGREDRELEGFRDFWHSAVRNATKLNWDLAWHNRIRDVHDRILRQAGGNRHHDEPFNPMVRAGQRQEAQYQRQAAFSDPLIQAAADRRARHRPPHFSSPLARACINDEIRRGALFGDDDG